ncbi:tRNA (adenosine(37)-N6)-threonylcarbamoyltransferase complex transferase subunit TsaD [Candidatus Roizmanbacteria bacterium RIFCSPLOWO2_12_FULL_40_12]|uniref:tRNA N6-adenosine threonylcarbamoyltransferase n=1 Tax=Candidatus Roizmanbacteria bacterium RIFCSPLOWO2_01_FULL_40_42 TaxID=1802066 RepID=A0A1F7J4Q1_9BACT|nr:MAG: tRNA (adenosine(37)-N6)-threonylcarbamoyltransferase complex transferase subunit TsaD [Candidatus Roizmanbacteria bacterium RIFCSPHIGHO2_01_FULL_40_98]OGK27345.1 MAG: tRNA (adenosine(37)-N6)-threonylcarbamoyltransferase complex transferase subunit TsaD [Candidatus Roizmanbacteria bacterium RIFCSPHIGHO2_02_FULL_40_53]OGK30783.1 MAG: tRNA (adenosine(37)-N6)-threonylcarbamoyltransferase complex transferase subunit TsaD [Candidatus Roizmanbacteria bacterium RIFCSPHIGHO2_12_41_18]OGK36450.1 M
MNILAIDTSADETSIAITEGRRIISNGVYSQILTHTQWGGIVPSLAKRAHQERIDLVIEEASKRFLKAKGEKKERKTTYLNEAMKSIDCIAVTYGPGLAIALEVGIQKAKDLAKKYKKKLIAVNHMEGHIYSCFAQNSKGKPDVPIKFPYLALLISGGHTELILLKDHLSYEVLGETVDDAAGEALDKAAKLLGFGYPGGPIIERLASGVKNKDIYKLPRPMKKSPDLNFSFSGLKTSFYYMLKKMSEKEINKNAKFLASAFQEAVFESLLIKTEKAINQTGVTNILVGGGVVANKHLRSYMRKLAKRHSGQVIFPPFPYLTGDNAGMIGIVAFYKAELGSFSKESQIDRTPRLRLSEKAVG